MNVDDPRLSFIPFDRGAREGDTVMLNRWWVVHPEKGLVMWRNTSPQCNSNEEIARRVGAMYPWAEIRFIETAYLPHDCRDYYP